MNSSTPNHKSLASVMQAINALGVKHPDLPALRARALEIHKEAGDLRSAASIAVVFWGSLKRGTPAADLLKADAEAVTALARDFEREAYGLARLTSVPLSEKRAARKARRQPPQGETLRG